MIGAKIIFFPHVCFAFRILHQNSSPGSVTFPQLGNRAEIYEPKVKLIQVTGLMCRERPLNLNKYQPLWVSG